MGLGIVIALPPSEILADADDCDYVVFKQFSRDSPDSVLDRETGARAVFRRF